MSYLDIVRSQLPLDEGTRNKPYKDTVGKTTIGIGRNLDDVGVSHDEIMLMLDNDIDRAGHICHTLYPEFDALSDNRKAALVNLAFNMGGGLSAFVHMNAAINAGDFQEAARQLMTSKWASQVQDSRSSRLREMLKDG